MLGMKWFEKSCLANLDEVENSFYWRRFTLLQVCLGVYANLQMSIFKESPRSILIHLKLFVTKNASSGIEQYTVDLWAENPENNLVGAILIRVAGTYVRLRMMAPFRLLRFARLEDDNRFRG
ncbi:hypothetical protein Tco_0987909 [Tanacetum coccineum]